MSEACCKAEKVEWKEESGGRTRSYLNPVIYSQSLRREKSWGLIGTGGYYIYHSVKEIIVLTLKCLFCVLVSEGDCMHQHKQITAVFLGSGQAKR